MHVVTRFAPSPTGYLHIGGARTALFNFLFARRHGGKYLLRIEDTDKERSTPEATEAILSGLAWFGLTHDGEAVFQSKNAPRHAEIAHALVERGYAYHCYLSKEALEQLREEARAKGTTIRSPWRDRPAAEAPEGTAPTIRIKAPLEGSIVIVDAVQGRVEVSASQLDDFILLRSDGTPTYMLAVVVDDHDMGITHIIRGDDHLNNAFRQQLIYEGMGWDVPIFAHIPLIHGADGAKLSKRHGALGVGEYQQMGYLPEALRNYPLRLGFSHGDAEIISDQEAVEWFALEALNKSAARFDFDKLDHLNGHYLRQCEDARLVQLVTPFLEALLGKPADAALLQLAIPTVKERAKTLTQMAEALTFYFKSSNPPMDDKAAAQLAEGKALLEGFIAALEAYKGDWQHEPLFSFAKEYADSLQIKVGALMAPVRVALTGSTASPSVPHIIEILEREESLARLKAVLV